MRVSFSGRENMSIDILNEKKTARKGHTHTHPRSLVLKVPIRPRKDNAIETLISPLGQKLKGQTNQIRQFEEHRIHYKAWRGSVEECLQQSR